VSHGYNLKQLDVMGCQLITIENTQRICMDSKQLRRFCICVGAVRSQRHHSSCIEIGVRT
jgi:hypothetical protein